MARSEDQAARFERHRILLLAPLITAVTLLPSDGASGSTVQTGPAPDSAAALRGAKRDVRYYLKSVRGGPQGQSSVLVRQPSFGLEPPERRRQAYLEEAARRRPRVIEGLDEHALDAPGNDWIAGYRVAFRIKQGWIGDAVTVAGECQASPWWCGALLAWALHVDGRSAEAEAAMDASLAAMPREMRCRWGEELRPILRGALRDRYDKASCEEQAALADRLWWLADPLHVRIGNGRKTEHFVRLVAMEFHHDEYVDWCEHAHHKRIIEGGWPPWWFALPASLDSTEPGQAFLPSETTWTDPLTGAPGDWDLSVRLHGERYMPPDGPISPLEQQTAFFERGDSVLVASAIGLADRMIVAGVALSTSERQPPVTALETEAEGPFRVQRRVPPNRYLVSVEAVAPAGRAYRTRFGHGLPDAGEGGLQMSDLLLFAWDDGLEHTFEDVFPHMMGTERVMRGQPLGVYWETYGLLEGRSVDVRVQLRRTGRGFLHRFGERLGLVGPDGPVSVRWTVPEEDVQVGRHLRLELSSQDPGTYEMRLEVNDGEGGAASVTRLIEIVDA